MIYIYTYIWVPLSLSLSLDIYIYTYTYIYIYTYLLYSTEAPQGAPYKTNSERNTLLLSRMIVGWRVCPMSTGIALDRMVRNRMRLGWWILTAAKAHKTRFFLFSSSRACILSFRMMALVIRMIILKIAIIPYSITSLHLTLQRQTLSRAKKGGVLSMWL